MGTIYNRSRSDDITVDGGGNDGIGSVHGLGTTGIAVLQLHRKFIDIEIGPDHYTYAVNELENSKY